MYYLPAKSGDDTYSAWFLADRTIGRAFGTVCRLSVVCRLSSVTFCILAKRLDRFA